MIVTDFCILRRTPPSFRVTRCKKKKASVKDSGGVLGKLGTDGRGGTEKFCPEFGSGWKRIGTKRRKGDKRGTLDYHYESPGGHKFKSKPEVERFLACLADECLARLAT